MGNKACHQSEQGNAATKNREALPMVIFQKLIVLKNDLHEKGTRTCHSEICLFGIWII